MAKFASITAALAIVRGWNDDAATLVQVAKMDQDIATLNSMLHGSSVPSVLEEDDDLHEFNEPKPLASTLLESQVAQLHQLATQSLYSVVDPATMEALKKSRSAIVNTTVSIRKMHAGDQELVDNTSKTVATCLSTYVEDSTLCTLNSWQAADGDPKDATTCSTDVGLKEQNMTMSCNSLETFSKGLAASMEKALLEGKVPEIVDVDQQACTSPIQPVAVGKWLKDLNSWVSEKNAEWISLQAKCQEATADFEVAQSDCDTTVKDYKSEYCTWRDGCYTKCEKQNTCHTVASKDFKEAHKNARRNAHYRKQDWTSAKTIECLLDVILMSEDTPIDVRADALTKCGNQTIDVSLLNIDNPFPDGIPSAKTCKLPVHPQVPLPEVDSCLAAPEDCDPLSDDLRQLETMHGYTCTAKADCSSHGTTSDRDKHDGCECQCTDDYTGDDCGIPPPCDADDDCSGHGDTSDMDNTDGCVCSCSDDFTGNNCAVPPRCETNHCNNHGTTDDPDRRDGCDCTCTDGFSGGNCAVPPPCLASTHCSSHGTTADKDKTDGCVCSCHGGYSGVDCSVPPPCDAQSDCSGHGSTNDLDKTDGCSCTCQDGYTGSDCGSLAMRIAWTRKTGPHDQQSCDKVCSDMGQYTCHADSFSSISEQQKALNSVTRCVEWYGHSGFTPFERAGRCYYGTSTSCGAAVTNAPLENGHTHRVCPCATDKPLVWTRLTGPYDQQSCDHVCSTMGRRCDASYFSSTSEQQKGLNSVTRCIEWYGHSGYTPFERAGRCYYGTSTSCSASVTNAPLENGHTHRVCPCVV